MDPYAFQSVDVDADVDFDLLSTCAYWQCAAAPPVAGHPVRGAQVHYDTLPTVAASNSASEGSTVELQDRSRTQLEYSIVRPAVHPLHESRSAEEFCKGFADFTGHSIQQVVDRTVQPDAPKAVYLTGSIPLGMATHGSDVDLVVLVDDRQSLVECNAGAITNTDQHLAFSSASDLLRAGLFLTVMNGVTVEVSVAMTPVIRQIYQRLRGKGPELSEAEIMTLGRVSTGWLLWQSHEYLRRAGVALPDVALDVYCSTRQFSYSLIYRLKAGRALELGDIPQALHLGRASVEAAYLAYFASEGMPYLGAKWLAQIGHARGAAARVERHPLLREGIQWLFPSYGSDGSAVAAYLRAVGEFLHAMRKLIEQKRLFRIAFRACPQIYPV
jgi:hypothetical protein